jgi:hypothetical protein
MLRMADLGEEEGRRELGKGVAETHKEATAHEVVEVLGRGLDRSTDNHDETTNDDARLAAIVISNERSDRKRSDGTDGVEGSEETESRLLGVAKVVLPVSENTEVVQHGSAIISFGQRRSWWANIPIVTCGRRRDTDDESIEVQLPQTWVRPPVDTLEMRSLRLSNFNISSFLVAEARLA